MIYEFVLRIKYEKNKNIDFFNQRGIRKKEKQMERKIIEKNGCVIF